MKVKGTAGLALCAMLGAMLVCPAQAASTPQRSASASRPAASTPPASTARQGGAANRPATAARGATAGASRHTAAAAGSGRHATASARGSRSRSNTASASYGGISCVPYARMITGMQISGNGGHWWYNAAGTYDRGQRPEPGSVLAFASSGGMRRGHVAVVSRVHGPRHIEIDHASWGGPGIRRGTVMRNVDVIDVSDRNDWTAVRVQVGWEQGAFGRSYPTYGFIHNRPDRGMMTAFTGGAVGTANAQPMATRLEEVAELPRTAPTRRSSSSRR